MNIKPLFAIAALDKFSFNGIRALLILYLVTHLHMMDVDAYKNYAAIMALSFLMPLVCGYLVDKFLYSKNIILFSGIWSGIGMFLLFIHSIYAFHLAIASLIVASGFIKTLIPTLLSRYSTENKINSDSLYSQLYVFFNFGAFFGTLGCSVLGEIAGWNYGFLIAGIAMLAISWLSFFISEGKETAKKSFLFNAAIQILIAILITLSFILLAFPKFLSGFLYVGFIIAIITLLIISRKKAVDTKNLYLLFYLMIIHTLFFAVYEQGSLSLLLFTDRLVDRSISAFFPFIHYQFALPVTFFQTIDPIFNVFIGVVFTMIWNYFTKHNIHFSFVGKFCFGLLTIATSFLILSLFPHGNLISPWWIVLTFIIFVVGEQCVVPIGFSAVSTLSPKLFTGFCMGIWFVAIAISEWLAERISTFVTPENNQAFNLMSYQHGFLLLAISIFCASVIFYSLYRITKSPLILIEKEAFCHPERSEGSLAN